MSGIETGNGEQAESYAEAQSEVVLFDFDNFFVCPARFYAPETQRVEEGYAVIYKEDGNVQQFTHAITVALNVAAQGDNTLQAVAAFQEQKAQQAQTEGLLFDAGTDEIH